YERSKHYYVMGQFSRFVHPGSRRIEAKTTDRTLKVTAYRNDQNLVIVAINNAHVGKNLTVTLDGLPEITQVQAIRTTRSENWRTLDPIRTGVASFTVSSPPVSISTFIASWRPLGG